MDKSNRLDGSMPDGSRWPTISIVTPSYNQGHYIEETIRSVLLQGYPEIEYIVIDGHSSDATVEVLEKYSKWMTYWVSEPDRGQSHAINKGLAKANGDIIAWINSDDLYLPGTFFTIAEAMYKGGKCKQHIVFGDCLIIDHNGKETYLWQARPVTTRRLVTYWRRSFAIPQQTVFMSAESLRGKWLDEGLDYVMDWDLYLRLSLGHSFHYIPKALAKFRRYEENKTARGEVMFASEHRLVSARYWAPGLETLQFRAEILVAPLVDLIKRLPGKLRIVLRTLLGDTTYRRLKNLKNMILSNQ